MTDDLERNNIKRESVSDAQRVAPVGAGGTPALSTIAGWNKCSYPLPDEGAFLTFRPGDNGYSSHIGVAYYHADEGWLDDGYHGPNPVTHWMPLPEPPTTFRGGESDE